MQRIAFGCQARVGKDTSANYVAERLGHAISLSFASPLYSILNYAQDVCGFENKKDRKFLQWIGTDWARAIDPHVWVNILCEKVDKIGDGDNIIVTDVRFVDEFEALKRRNFVMVRLIRDTEEKADSHASEQSALQAELPWDYVIENNGTLEELYVQLDSIIKYVKHS